MWASLPSMWTSPSSEVRAMFADLVDGEESRTSSAYDTWRASPESELPIPGVFPPGLPREVTPRQRLERHPAQIVIESPTRGNMPDDQHPRVRPARPDIRQHPAHARDRAPPAFAVGIRRVQIPVTLGVHLVGRTAVAVAVVALAQAPIEKYRNIRVSEGDGCCLGRAPQV